MKGNGQMKRFATFLLTVLIYVLSVSYNSTIPNTYSQKANIADEGYIFDFQNAEDDFGSDSDFNNSGSDAGSSETSSEKLVLMAENAGFVHNNRDNKYYISSRQRLWIQSKDRPDGGAVGVQKIAVKIDNGDYHEYFGSKTGLFTLEKEGPHTVVFKATDRLHNVEQPKVFGLIVDNSAPWVEVEYLTPDPYKYCVKANVIYVPANHQIIARAFDVGSGVKTIDISQNGGGYQEYKSGDPIKADKSGWNVIRIKSTDRVLNESAEYILNVFVDDIAPAIQITPKYALLTAQGEVASDTPDSSSSTASDGFNDTSAADEDVPIEEIGKGDDNRSLLPGQSGDSNARFSGVDNNFAITGYDKESGIALLEIKLDNSATWDIYRKPIRFFTQGRHSIEVRATDCVGNQSTKKLNIIIDNLPPESKIGGESPKKVPGGGESPTGQDDISADDITPANEE